MSKRSAKRVDPFYLTHDWENLRLARLRLDRWKCQHCGVRCRGRKHGESSPHVDHIETVKDRPDLRLDIANVRTLCHSCHSKRTRADQLNRPAIGADGYPV